VRCYPAVTADNLLHLLFAEQLLSEADAQRVARYTVLVVLNTWTGVASEALRWRRPSTVATSNWNRPVVHRLDASKLVDEPAEDLGRLAEVVDLLAPPTTDVWANPRCADRRIAGDVWLPTRVSLTEQLTELRTVSTRPWFDAAAESAAAAAPAVGEHRDGHSRRCHRRLPRRRGDRGHHRRHRGARRRLPSPRLGRVSRILLAGRVGVRPRVIE
jgi:hypothetical protein